ncbi:hypothetical protein [Singapore grouper iridovirus]|nr:hypothetical protein [Singapore grouper iridovirus]
MIFAVVLAIAVLAEVECADMTCYVGYSCTAHCKFETIMGINIRWAMGADKNRQTFIASYDDKTRYTTYSPKKTDVSFSELSMRTKNDASLTITPIVEGFQLYSCYISQYSVNTMFDTRVTAKHSIDHVRIGVSRDTAVCFGAVDYGEPVVTWSDKTKNPITSTTPNGTKTTFISRISLKDTNYKVKCSVASGKAVKSAAATGVAASVLIGNDFNISCAVPPGGSIKWYYGDEPLEGKSSGAVLHKNGALLTLIKPKRSGKYTCVVNEGESVTITHLTIDSGWVSEVDNPGSLAAAFFMSSAVTAAVIFVILLAMLKTRYMICRSWCPPDIIWNNLRAYEIPGKL